VAFRFLLVHVNGEDLGEREFAVEAWKLGDLIPLGEGSLRVVAVEWHAEDDPVSGTLTVEVAS
jgi:hypothetical protein